MNKLQRWVVEFGGPTKLAYILGVHPSSVDHWLKGRSHPKLPTAQRIVRLSKDTLTFDDIIECSKRPEHKEGKLKAKKKKTASLF